MTPTFSRAAALSGLCALVILAACKQSKFKGYDQTDQGLYCKSIVEGKGKKPNVGDVLTLTLKYFTEKDSLLFDSKQTGQPFMVKLEKPAFKGSFEEGFANMGEGDSSSFMVSADSFFTRIVRGDLPKEVKKGSYLRFEVGLKKIMTLKELEAQQKVQSEKMKKDMEARKGIEGEQIKAYLEKEKITVKPSQSGVYLIEVKKGTGAVISKGDTIGVHYSGRLLSGEEFDSSDRSKDPVKFQIGVGMVIPGWDEALVNLRVGSKVTMIIPSSQAYGASGAGPLIKPYTPLLFDVEIITSKKSK
jgi:FKBP-type peptidyl-prolyl cis-trans isomerase